MNRFLAAIAVVAIFGSGGAIASEEQIAAEIRAKQQFIDEHFLATPSIGGSLHTNLRY